MIVCPAPRIDYARRRVSSHSAAAGWMILKIVDRSPGDLTVTSLGQILKYGPDSIFSLATQRDGLRRIPKRELGERIAPWSLFRWIERQLARPIWQHVIVR